jgi:hypothetical protein
MTEMGLHELKQLSQDLVRDFLALVREGEGLHGCICLFGSEQHLMKLLAQEMRAKLALMGREDVRVDVQDERPRIVAENYCIDVTYFLETMLVDRRSHVEVPELLQDYNSPATVS